MGKGFYWKLAFQNLKTNRRVYLPYLLSSVGIIMMFYILKSLSPSIRQDEMYGGITVATVLDLGGIIIGVFSVLFLFYTNSFLMKRRKKELGLYNILGMEKRHISRIIFRETLLTSAGAILLGLLFGVLFSRAMFLALGKVLMVEIPIAFSVPTSAVVSTVALFAAIFFVTMIYNMLQVQLSKPIELLHGGETGEKEPRAHWLLAVLGAVSLGIGYWMAVTIQDPVEALVWFFIAVLLVILGTYLLFITGITALLKVLKKKKAFYYKANHFTTISGMLYRMKQNAAGLASICILFTCLLVTVSTTFSLYIGMEGIIRARYPRNIMVNAYGVSDETREGIRQAVQEECQRSGFTPENVMDLEILGQRSAARVGNRFSFQSEEFSNTFAVFTFYSLEEYNRITGQSETLAEGEMLLSDPRGTYPDGDAIVLDDTEYKIRRTDFNLSDGESMAMIYEIYCLVVPDADFLNHQAFYSGPFDSYANNFYYYFDVAGGEEDVLALQEAIQSRLTSPGNLSYEMLEIENSFSSRTSFYALYGGLFFLGIFLGVLFLMGTAMIIYYKQVSEGYEDARRFNIMQKVGMSHSEVKKSIHSQVMAVFFLPLLTAVIHLCFSFPMLQKILLMMNLTDFWLLFFSFAGCVAVFGVVYAIIYLITARTYYKIVESSFGAAPDRP